MTVQKRENDLVLGTFGRGFYVLDDYSPLREVTAQALAQEAELFPLRHAYQYEVLTQQNAAWGNDATPNPPYGAVFTYHVGPNFSGNLAVAVSDEGGRELCRIDVPETQGVQRAAWNLRVAPPPQPAAAGAGGRGAGGGGGGGGGGRGGGGGPQCVSVAPAPAPEAAPQPGAGAGRRLRRSRRWRRPAGPARPLLGPARQSRERSGHATRHRAERSRWRRCLPKTGDKAPGVQVRGQT